MTPPSRRVLAVGRTLSGKTEMLWRRWLRREPRLIIVDPGEWRARFAREPHTASGPVFNVYGADGVREALRDRAAEQAERFTIVVDADRDELGDIQALLIPPREWDRSPVPAFGGLALFLDEVDLSMPTGDNRLGSLTRRGRHVGLSVYLATQRPASVNKEASANVDFLAILSLDEPRDVEYLKSRLGEVQHRAALDWARSAPYRSALYHPPTGQMWRLPPEPL